MIGAGMLPALAACASGPQPDAEMAAAELALDQAEDADAAARAPAPYALARDKLERARAAMADGENFEARRLAEQALVDAQLAEAAARSEIARENARSCAGASRRCARSSRGATRRPPEEAVR